MNQPIKKTYIIGDLNYLLTTLNFRFVFCLTFLLNKTFNVYAS